MAPSGNITTGNLMMGTRKLEAVTMLLNKLTRDLQEKALPTQELDAALEELKVYGRDPRNADPIFTKEGIETLARYAFESASKTTSQNALRVLANSLVLEEGTRQKFVDLGYEAEACEMLKQDNLDDEFLVSRVVFLTTYNTNISLTKLIDQHHLADSIVQNLARHAKRAADHSTKAGKAKVDPMEDMALSETLKLLFNVTHFCTGRISSFTSGIPHIVTILTEHSLPPTKPLDPPFGQLVNALLNLQLEDKSVQSSLFPEAQPAAVVDRLVELLDMSTTQYSDNELEQVVTPLVGVISKMNENAPESVRVEIRKRLLPAEEDRQNVLGKGGSLASRLLRNSTNPVAPQLRDAISHLLFELSDKDASRFVENVGYGFASGFLFQNNIPVPENASGAHGTGDESHGNRPTNPVTGQFLDREDLPDIPEMSQEEKEREAERLFVLFERLKKTGIIDVQNPVEQAYREGRVQELDDDGEPIEDVD
ncbi:Ric8-like protein [Pleurostoma richardsiae]|uniref:Ric8-like protein n=1 Tax=Pleurostoma richardsiae TaxID=41990 RepID=A0AA38VUZ0_9PEZI|nr:Ric8-like protein [Pleurostoma richardsiae]